MEERRYGVREQGAQGDRTQQGEYANVQEAGYTIVRPHSVKCEEVERMALFSRGRWWRSGARATGSITTGQPTRIPWYSRRT
jgi:hypothetical protein